MSYSSHEGYAAAAKIDRIIDGQLQNHDPTDPDNKAGYEALIRTIHTTLNIIRREMGVNPAVLIPE
ncbi:hypothetical protein LCGC14_2606300 [marine sediment metagenome]|uniref:Uncharacterized protein n=1 Tax=marine sediment metagenome TaxID=412755 RepID=A0A0F9AUW8_9ZZZZ